MSAWRSMVSPSPRTHRAGHYRMGLRRPMSLVGAPAVGERARAASGLQQRFAFPKDQVLPSCKPRGAPWAWGRAMVCHHQRGWAAQRTEFPSRRARHCVPDVPLARPHAISPPPRALGAGAARLSDASAGGEVPLCACCHDGGGTDVQHARGLAPTTGFQRSIHDLLRDRR
jgi:hypothetical protein